MKESKTISVPQETIEGKILLIRGKKVMLDKDLAILYGVETKYLKRQVKRNIERFPNDFMFQLSVQEFNDWRCQFVTSISTDKMGLRYPPYAFTEQGVAMLSSILRSKRAVQVNIQIMRTFIKMKEMLSTHKELKQKIEVMERKYDSQFKVVFDVLKKLVEPPVKTQGKIGFRPKK